MKKPHASLLSKALPALALSALCAALLPGSAQAADDSAAGALIP